MSRPTEDLSHLIKKTVFHHYPGTTVVGCVIKTTCGYQSHGYSIASDGCFDLERGKEIALRNAKGRLNSLEAYVRRRQGVA